MNAKDSIVLAWAENSANGVGKYGEHKCCVKVVVASLAVAAVSASLFAARPIDAGSCAALSDKAIGVKQSETSGRTLKQLNRKAHHWAKKSGYKKVSVGKLSTSCKKKGAL